MQGLTPTILSIQDDIARQYGLEDPIPSNQTLNYYLGLVDGNAVGNRVTKAFMLGSDGRTMRSGSCGHLYQTLPLIARPLSNPLTVAERKQYYLRKEVTVSGTQYEVFYAKPLPVMTPVQSFKYTEYSTPLGDHTTTALVLPPPNVNWDNVLTAPSIIKIVTEVDIPFTAIDVANLKQACSLLNITDTDILEIGFISAVEYSIGTGLAELSKAICTYHTSLDGPLLPPGIQVGCGTITGINL